MEEEAAAAAEVESSEPTAPSESRRRLLGEREARRSTGGGSGIDIEGVEEGGQAAVYACLPRDDDGREADFGGSALGSPEASKASAAPASAPATGEFSEAPASAVAAPNVGLSAMVGRSCASLGGSRSGCRRLSLFGIGHGGTLGCAVIPLCDF